MYDEYASKKVRIVSPVHGSLESPPREAPVELTRQRLRFVHYSTICHVSYISNFEQMGAKTQIFGNGRLRSQIKSWTGSTFRKKF